LDSDLTSLKNNVKNITKEDSMIKYDFEGKPIPLEQSKGNNKVKLTLEYKKFEKKALRSDIE
jgi:hypothetical protein